MLFIKRLIGAATIIAIAPAAHAVYPDKAVRLIVPFGAGGITDIIARQLGQELGAHLNQSVVIENRSGAGGTIGAQTAAAAAPDGYTVFMGTVGTQIVNPLIMDKINYDPKQFVPVGMISGSPYVLAARSSLGIKNFKDFVEYAKAHPNQLNFGSAGIGSSPHLGLELLKLTSDLDIAHIPFKSGGEAVNAAVGGHGDVVMDAIPVVMPHVKSGKLVALALAAENRSTAAPDVPSSTEVGDEGLRISSWNALFVPAGTPDAVVETLNLALQKALASKDLKQRFEGQGSEVYTGTLAEYKTFINAETQKWERIIKTANIQLN